MYFVKRGDDYIDVAGKSFRDFFAGKLEELPGERPTISDWANHLTTIFPEVRLKRYLEMRGADGGLATTALAHRLSGSGCSTTTMRSRPAGTWSRVERRAAPEVARRRAQLGFQAEIGNRNVLTLAQETLRLAARGLSAAQLLDRNGRDETRYLRPLEESIARGITPAEELLEKFHGEWSGTSIRFTTNMRIDRS